MYPSGLHITSFPLMNQGLNIKNLTGCQLCGSFFIQSFDANYSNQIGNAEVLLKSISSYLSGVTCIFEQNFVHVRARVLEQLVVRVEDDDGDLTVAEDGQLIGLLHQAKFALCKGNLERRLNV